MWISCASCPAPVQVNVSNITSSSADFGIDTATGDWDTGFVNTSAKSRPLFVDFVRRDWAALNSTSEPPGARGANN